MKRTQPHNPSPPGAAAGAQPNFSLIDGVACLQAVAGSESACAAKQLAEDLGLDPTRVSRLLKTLNYLGFVEQNSSRKYQPGPALHVLAAQSLFGSRLLSVALPYLEKLSRHGHLLALGVLWREQVAYLYHQPPGVTQAEAIGRAGLYPARDSAIGLALLAANPEGEISEQNDPELTARLEQVRAEGYAHLALPEGQHRLGVCIGRDKPFAAIALAGGWSADALPTLLDDLRHAAMEIDTILSGKSLKSTQIPEIQQIIDERAA